MSRAIKSVLAACGVLALAPAAAAADGLPVPMDGFGTTSVVQPGGDGPRYATVRAGTDTELLQIDQDGGEITGSRTIDGRFTIPLVAIDGTPSGLSADGGTLALISPRTNFDFPRRETSFVIVDIKSNGAMRAQPPLTLRGDFSFDALSPDGETMFLVEYRTRDYNDYVVREYDLREERLLREPVRFSHEVAPGEMRGLPMTRATSSDGRWEYTLYNGGGGRNDLAFVHVLDTVEGTSHCVELSMIDGRAAWRVGLRLSGNEVTLIATRGGETVATMNAETYEVSEPPPPPGSSAAPAQADDGGISGVAVGAIAAGIALGVGTAIGLRRRRRAAELPADPFGTDEPDAPVEPQADPERARVSA